MRAALRSPRLFSPRGPSPRPSAKHSTGRAGCLLRQFSSEFPSSVPPDVAGQRAYDLRSSDDASCAESGGSHGSMPTLLSHAGLPPQGEGNEPLSPPIELATTYERPPDGNYELEGGEGGRIYARTHNSTRSALEGAVAAAEVLVPRRRPRRETGPNNGDEINWSDDGSPRPSQEKLAHPPPPLPVCAAFSSGMAAASAVLLAHTAPVRVVLPDDVYHGVPTALISVFRRHGVMWDAVDMTDAGAVTDALMKSMAEIERTGSGKGSEGDVLLWMETLSNPLCKVTDICALCELADGLRSDVGVNITTLVDSTWAPPPITQPLLLGADAVLHSATKYLGGHSDVLMGIVSASSSTEAGRRLGASLKEVQSAAGSVASPFDSWLVLRGLRTLDVRLRRQCSNAAVLAEFLSAHPLVERVHYPGLPCHPGRAVAARQMSGGMCGGMLSFEVAGPSAAAAVAGAVRTVRRATSLGGTETLIEHRASIEPEGRRTSPPGLLRVSAGLEDAEDLMEDLDAALRVAERITSRGAGGSRW